MLRIHATNRFLAIFSKFNLTNHLHYCILYIYCFTPLIGYPNPSENLSARFLHRNVNIAFWTVPTLKIPLFHPFKRYSEKVGQPPGTLIYLGEEQTEPVRITIIDYDETRLYEEEVQTVNECLPFIDTETVTWIQIEGIHETSVIEERGESFDIDRLLREDLMSPTQLPKIEVYEDYTFITLKNLDYNTASTRVFREQISLIIGLNFVISVQENRSGIFTFIQNRLRNTQGRIRRMHSGYLAYALIDIIVDHYFIVLDEINERIQVLEAEIIKDPSPEVLAKVNVVATFFIPLTFIAGIYGMNFKFMPELESQWGYPVVLLAMLGISIGMFIFFKYKKWF